MYINTKVVNMQGKSNFMQPLEKRIINRRKLKQAQIISELENELILIQRETQLAHAPLTLEQIFYTHGKDTMMNAKFYHECMTLNVPCVLDVSTKFGQVDAIIEIDQKFHII